MMIMKQSLPLILIAACASTDAFVVVPRSSSSKTITTTSLSMSMAAYDEQMKKLNTARNSGANFKPQDGRMQATDVGDFFPEGYVDELDFENGLKGVSGLSHPKVAWSMPKQKEEKDRAPEMPGMDYMEEDYLEKDVVMHMLGDGIELCDAETEQCIPEGMQFIPSSVPDGHIEMQIAITSPGEVFNLEIKPYCMGYEDYYAAFAPGSHPAFYVTPNAGRMDRRGGESTFMKVVCDPRGKDFPADGKYSGTLVINLPEDDSKLTYTVVANLIGP